MNNKKELIIESAEEIFSRFGYKKSTMEDIASQAHIGKATLYYYFPSKEVIFGEVIRKDSERFRSKLNEAAASAHTPEAKIRAYVATRMIHLEDMSKFYPTLTQEYLDHYFFVENVRKEFHDYENTVLSKLLQDGIDQNDFFIDLVLKITSKKMGTGIVVDENQKLLGIITDGDLRRSCVEGEKVFDKTAKDIMHENPKTIQSGVLALKALKVMEEYNITSLIVQEDQKVVGLVHIHDLVKAGIKE